jgi:hypothetical protein
MLWRDPEIGVHGEYCKENVTSLINVLTMLKLMNCACLLGGRTHQIGST